MKNLYLKFLTAVLFIVLVFAGNVSAQNNNLGIGTDTPDASAMLEILSNNKGLLVPRMTASERLAIPSPANALLVYDTDSSCFYYYKLPISTWINLCTAFAETDPQVGINTTDFVPKWNGTSLVTSNIYSFGTFAGINATTPIGSSQFVVGSTSPSYSGMYVNTAGTAGARRPFYGYAIGGFSGTWTYLEEASNQWRLYHNGDRMVVESSGNVGIGTLTATAKLDVNGKLRVRDVTIDNTKDSILVVSGDGTVSYRDASTLGVGVVSNIPKVKICWMDWMDKNLDVDTYRNGDPIPQISDSTIWGTLTTGAYCYYNFDSATYAAVYGKLYNWYAVNDPRGLAPEGWHIPTDFEWTTLENCLGGNTVAGGLMKETGTTHWNSPNTSASNLSGFTGLPGGNIYGTFQNVGNYGYWWSSTESNSSNAWYRYLSFNNGNIIRVSNNKLYGFSVRCLRD